MARSVMQMVEAAAAVVPGIDPTEAWRRQQTNPETLLIDVRDLANRRDTGMPAGAIAISAGNLPFCADQEVPEEWRDPRLQDRARPVITLCDLGPMSALSAQTLKEMGFADVAYVDGGMQAWCDAGLPTAPPTDA